MPITNDSLNKDLYRLLKVRGFDPIPKDSEGETSPVPDEADVFRFTFKRNERPMGSAWITVDSNQKLIVYFNDDINNADAVAESDNSLSYDDSWTGFLKTLKMWAQRRQLGFEIQNQDHLASDMAQRTHMKKKENISENTITELAKWRQGYSASGHPAGYKHKSGDVGPVGGTFTDEPMGYGDTKKVPVHKHRDEPDQLAGRSKTSISTTGQPLQKKNAQRNLKAAIKQSAGKHGPVGVLPENEGVAEGSDKNLNEMNPYLVQQGLEVVIDFLSKYPTATAVTAGAAGAIAGGAIIKKLVTKAWQNHKELEQLKQDILSWSYQKLHANKNVGRMGGKVAKIIQKEIERRKQNLPEQGVAEGYNDISVGDYVSYDDGPGTDRWEVVSIEGNRVELRNDQGGTTFADINDVLKEQGVTEGQSGKPIKPGATFKFPNDWNKADVIHEFLRKKNAVVDVEYSYDTKKWTVTDSRPATDADIKQWSTINGGLPTVNEKGVAEGFSDIVKGIKRKVAGKEDPKEVEHMYGRIARSAIKHKTPDQAEKDIQRYNRVSKIVNKEGVAEGKNMTTNKTKVDEGYYPMGKQASYSDAIPTVKIVLQHTRQIQEGEQRYRNIARIFLENTQGERILCPVSRPGMAQVFARHLAEGGVPNDERWNHIKGLCEEYNKMAGFARAVKNGQFNESAQRLVEAGLNHFLGLRENLGKMRGHRGYNAYFESWTPTLMETEGDDTNLNELFVQETLDPRIESVMPILSKLKLNLGEMREVDELAEWADNLTEMDGETESKINKVDQDQEDMSEGSAKHKSNDDDKPFNYDEWKKSGKKPRAQPGWGPKGTGTTLAKGIEQDIAKSKKNKQGVAEGDPGYDKHSFIGKIRRSEEADNKGWGQLGRLFHAGDDEEAARKALRKGNRYYNMTRGNNKTPGGFPKTTVEEQGVAEGEIEDGQAAHDKINTPASLRKAKGGDWKVTGSDLEKSKSRTGTSPEGLSAIKKLAGLGDHMTNTPIPGLGEDEAVSESASNQELVNSAETMTLEQFVSVYGEENANIWHEVNGEQGLSEGLGESVSFREMVDVVDEHYPKYYAKLSDSDISDKQFEQEIIDAYKKIMQKQGVAEGSTSKEKQKTPYRNINSPAARKAADAQREKMAKDQSAKPGKELLDRIKKKDVDEGLDANQKRVGQLGPTDKVGSKGAVGKLVGTNESIERDPLNDIKRLLGK